MLAMRVAFQTGSRLIVASLLVGLAMQAAAAEAAEAENAEGQAKEETVGQAEAETEANSQAVREGAETEQEHLVQGAGNADNVAGNESQTGAAKDDGEGEKAGDTVMEGRRDSEGEAAQKEAAPASRPLGQDIKAQEFSAAKLEARANAGVLVQSERTRL